MGPGGKIDKISAKYHPLAKRGGKGYRTVSKLSLADREIDKLFNKDR